jgi:hypothetical protein
VIQVEECLPSKCDDLSSKLNTTKNKTEKVKVLGTDGEGQMVEHV